MPTKVQGYIASGKIPLAAWCTHAAKELGLQINGEKTSNRAEGEMWRQNLLKARMTTPIDTLIKNATQWERLMANGRRVAGQLQGAGAILLPYAQKMYEAAKIRASQGYHVSLDGGASTVTVKYNNEERYKREVDLTAVPIRCTCDVQACHHIVAALRAAQLAALPEVTSWADGIPLLQHLFDEQDFVARYVQAYNVPPTTRPVLAVLTPSSSTKAPAPNKKRGAKGNLKRMLSAIEGGTKKKRKRDAPHVSTASAGDISLLPEVGDVLSDAPRIILSAEATAGKAVDKAISKLPAAVSNANEVVLALTDGAEKEEGRKTVAAASQALQNWAMSHAQAQSMGKVAADAFEEVLSWNGKVRSGRVVAGGTTSTSSSSSSASVAGAGAGAGAGASSSVDVVSGGGTAALEEDVDADEEEETTGDTSTIDTYNTSLLAEANCEWAEDDADEDVSGEEEQYNNLKLFLDKYSVEE